MCVISSDTGLRNANINTIYQITIVSHQDKKEGGGGWGELFWKEMQRTEPISSSQVVKLKVCDPVMSQGGRPMALLVCLGKERGTKRSGWHGRRCVDVTADGEQLVSDELEATRVPILQKRSSHPNGGVESCRDGSVLFLLLGLLFVDLFLCLGLLRVALVLFRSVEDFH